MHFEAARVRAEMRHNESMALAWHIVALQRHKRLPPLSRLMIKQRRRPRRQSWEEQLSVMRLFKGVTTHYPEESRRDG